MKNRSIRLIVLIFASYIAMSLQTSCKTKEGCGLEEKYNNPDMESNGGKSNLFSKGHRKKMKRG